MATTLLLGLPGHGQAYPSLEEIVGTCTAKYVDYALAHVENQPKTEDFDAAVSEESDDASQRPSEALTPLSDFCAEGAEWFEQSEWQRVMTTGPNGASLEDLREADRITRLYTSNPDNVLDTAELDEIIASLPPWQNQTPSMWQRFVDWVQQWFKNNEVDPPEWLTNLSLSGSFFKVVSYAAMAFIVLAAIVLIWRELRLVRRRSFQPELPAHPLVPEGIEHLSIADLKDMPAHLQPGLIFGKLVQHIISHTQYNIGFGNSHRQIADQLELHESASDIRRLAEAAEQASYGDWTPSNSELDQLLEMGARLVGEQPIIGESA
ncbi:MAG: hypothetical protein AAF541_01705 [Pseudomonadota bacterium]